MYEKVDCSQCLNYEYMDNSFSNNCIHYSACLNRVQKNNSCQHNWVENNTTRGYNALGLVVYRTYYTCSICGKSKCVDIIP